MFKNKSLFLTFSILLFNLSQAQNKPYKAGEIYTENIYQYGKMEVRMLAAKGNGIISNFFTFKEGSELASTFWEEIDIEVFGQDGANSWQTNLITGQGNTNLIRTEGVHFNNGLGDNYHTYAIEWTPTSVTWLIDGIITREINDGQSLDISSKTTLRFNIWNPNIPEWVGPFDSNILPVHMYVNWIKFYEWNGNSFNDTPILEDNFDNLNTSTWTKANHTFAENQSDFIPENVNVENGYLVLSITNDDEIGYSGTPPVDSNDITLSNDTFEEIENTNLNIYPNPSKAGFTTTYNKNEKLKLELYNTAGKLLNTFNYDNSLHFGEKLSSGVYFLKFTNELGTVLKTKKVIKE